MKAPKYIVNTDHKYGFNHEDSYIRLTSAKLLDAMAEASNILAGDDHLYCSTIYQLIPGTKGTEYRPVARNYGHGGFYAKGCGSWNADHYLERVNFKTFELFVFHFDR